MAPMPRRSAPGPRRRRSRPTRPGSGRRATGAGGAGGPRDHVVMESDPPHRLRGRRSGSADRRVRDFSLAARLLQPNRAGDGREGAAQPRANGIVPCMTVSLTVLTGFSGTCGRPSSLERHMREDQVRCAAVLVFAVDVIDVRSGWPAMRAWPRPSFRRARRSSAHRWGRFARRPVPARRRAAGRTWCTCDQRLSRMPLSQSKCGTPKGQAFMQ